MDSNEDEHEHDPFRTVFVAIIFLFLMYFALYHLYICSCLPRSRRSHHHFRNHRPPMLFFPSNASHTASRGLDPAVLKSLPVFVFSNVTHKDPIDCAVCLSEFETGESGRVLPGCEHAFHVECIDMWFHSHSTCPLCRSLVESPAEIVIAISPEPVSATVPDSTSGSGSSAMPLDGLRREPAATETTRRSFSDDLTRNSPANHSVTSPVSQMLSFMSRKGRSAPSSFAGAPSQPPSSSCQMVMNESNIERGGEEIKSGFRHVDVP